MGARLALIPAGIAGVLGTLWGLVLVFIAKVIYDDGEFSEAWYFALHTGLMLAAGLLAGGGALAFRWLNARYAVWAMGVAAVLSLGAFVPGLAFSWTGFSGFGTTFFFIFVLPATVLIGGLSLLSVGLAVLGERDAR